jgi:AraC family transcriptional regulator, arabinose operon regulatory protein
MNDTSEIERQRALAGFYYRLMRGLKISPAQVRASLDAWNRLVLPPSSSSPATLPHSEAYLPAFLDNMKKTGFMRVCHQWESKFDEHGAPLPHADVRRFLTDAIYLQYHSPHTHHDFFCICPTFTPEGVMDFQITHPFACDFWTVCLTETGAGIIETNSVQLHLLLPGSIALLPPGFVGRVGRARDSRQWRCLYLGFRPKPRWFDFLTLAFSAKVPVVLKPNTPQELAALRLGFGELSLMRCERGDINERLSFNLIENLLIRLYGLQETQQQGGAGRGFPKAIDARVSAAVDFVLSHYQKPLTMQDIAARANLSPSRLAALFKSHYGIGLIQWRDSIRLSRARDLIATTNLRIAEIAQQVGWEDQLYFSKRFKDKYRDSPRNYRKHAQPNVRDAALHLDANESTNRPTRYDD